jgi:mono/diheme cytochrome c family protein
MMYRILFIILALSISLEAKVDFKRHIQPILKKSCTKCHGTKKQKGKLRLDSPLAIRKGSENGAIILAGNPVKSKLYSLIILPKGHEDIMPSKGDRLTRVETETIKRWIMEGANLGDGKVTAKVDKTGKKYIKPIYDIDSIAKSVSAPDKAVLKQLTQNKVFIREISGNGHLLELSFQHVENPKNLQLNLLAKISANVLWLNLSGQSISTGDMAHVKGLKNLQRLSMHSSDVGDQHLSAIANLKSLTYLNLYNTQVSDAGMKHLSGLNKLKDLYLWNSKVTASGASKVKKSISGLTVNIGK